MANDVTEKDRRMKMAIKTLKKIAAGKFDEQYDNDSDRLHAQQKMAKATLENMRKVQNCEL